MSDTDRSARPRQLTMAGGFVIGGSVLLVLTVFDTIAGLHSVDMRDQITKMVTSPTGAGLGLSVSEAITAMRVGLMVAAACAAATAVLGVYALQRHRAARLGLSILAVPILLTSPLTGGLIGAVVVAATFMLWSGPARDWFAGRAPRETGQTPHRQAHPGPWEESMPSPQERNRRAEPDVVPPAAETESPPVAVPAPLSAADPSTTPQPTSGFGELPSAPDRPPSWVPPPYAELARAGEVPVTVKIACILTWVFSGVVALVYAALVVVLIAAHQRVVDYVVATPEWQRSHLQQGVLLPVLWIGCLMFLAWALGACVLAWFTWKRHNWARWLLAVSAATALLAALFAFPVGLLHQAAAALTVAGLFSVAARAWFAPNPAQPRQPGPVQGQGQAPPPPTDGKPPVW